MNAKLLLDENISPRVALDLRDEGVDAVAVRDRGLRGASDPEVFRTALEEERIVVTKNVRDFERLAGSCALHAGVVLLEHNDLLRGEQLETLRRVVIELARRADMVNTVLRVAADGTMTFELVPPEA